MAAGNAARPAGRLGRGGVAAAVAAVRRANFRRCRFGQKGPRAVILCDHRIEQAVSEGRIIIDPPLEPSRLESSALNLRVGDDFLTWKKDLTAKGLKPLIDL